MKYYPARILAVTPGSVATQAGLRPGDVLLALNGQPVRDVIDVQIYAAEPELRFNIKRDSQRLNRTAQRRYGQPLGLEFTEELFDDPLHVCRNACDFCFVAQMPPGLRPSLYMKDDDYRLSFLHGNYVTLTNLTEADWARIAEQFLSPLYVSVHATAPDVRVSLLRNPHAGEILAQLTRLVEAGITLHTQAVLTPGRNDGAHLDHTIADLAALYPGVASLTIVPVGLTREHAAGLRPYTDAEAATVLAQALDWQARLRAELGMGFVYPSDEWFIRAGVPTPLLEAYDGLHDALIENGVGMVRRFEDAWPARQVELATVGGPSQVWITGTLFAPLLAKYAAAFTLATGIAATVIPVHNRRFGETVTVAGLLTVEDISAALDEIPTAAIIVTPDVIFRGPEGRSLDERTAEELATAVGRKVYVVREM